MNIEFIKWLVGYAEGFSVDGYDILHVLGCRFDRLDTLSSNKITYPLLLQRAIEGINRDLNNKYSICTEHNNLEVYHHKLGLMDGWIRANQDQAKEAALKYIWEQEE